jgi:hypothetical protein
MNVHRQQRRAAPDTDPFVLYGVVAVIAAMLALVGIVLDVPFLAYGIPAALQAIPATHSTLGFLVYKRYLSHWIAFGGCFLFFHFQVLSPQYWADFTAQMDRYLVAAKVISVVGINLFPIGLVLVMKLLLRFGGSVSTQWPEQVFEPRYQQRLYKGFLAIFVLAAIPQVLYGQLVVGAVRQIVYMRAGATAAGESYYVRFSGEGVSSSLLNLQHFSTSLVILSLLLWNSRHRMVVRSLFPLSALWTTANLLGGTRTQLLLFAVALLVVFGADPKRRITISAAVLIPAGVFVLSQLASVFRATGLLEFNWAQFQQAFGRLQGLETMHDQTRAIHLFLEGYRSPWSLGFAPADFLFGLIYRPIEFFMFIIPRGLFPWKPVDPTFDDLNRMVITLMNLNPNEILWGLTAGIIGREMLRWGVFGGAVALFWFGFLLQGAERAYRSGPHCLDNRVLAGAIAGSCIAMYRDLTPLWCLQMFPAVFVILYARGVLPRPRVQPGRPRLRANPSTRAVIS